MNTLRKDTMLPKTGENIIILEKFEFGFPKWQLDEVLTSWEGGAELEQIAFSQKRPPEEILFALIHLAQNVEIKRPFAFRQIKN